ncbi:MAG TPA: DUF2255 family protein [Mycobacterium sp.]|nr:DUF2255 family protein [Mycobacterium sp.]
MTWSADDLDRIDTADEMRVAGRRRDGRLRPARIVWMVVLDGTLYSRSVNGPDAAWFRGTRATRRGHIEAGGVDADVEFVDVDPADAVQADLDAAYRQKYGRRYPGPTEQIMAATARSATVKILPQPTV